MTAAQGALGGHGVGGCGSIDEGMRGADEESENADTERDLDYVFLRL